MIKHGRVGGEFQGRYRLVTVAGTPASATPASATPAPAMVQNTPELFAELKKLRLHLAKERSVPAFVISSDKTLNQMANDMPITENDFPAINGVGNSKLEKFYQPFQAVIAKF